MKMNSNLMKVLSVLFFLGLLLSWIFIIIPWGDGVAIGLTSLPCVIGFALNLVHVVKTWNR